MIMSCWHFEGMKSHHVAGMKSNLQLTILLTIYNLTLQVEKWIRSTFAIQHDSYQYPLENPAFSATPETLPF